LKHVYDVIVCGNAPATRLVTKIFFFEDEIPDKQACQVFSDCLNTCAGEARHYGTAEVYIMKRSAPWAPNEHLLKHGIKNPNAMQYILRNIIQIWRDDEHIAQHHLFYATTFNARIYLTKARQPGESINNICRNVR
jgi:hypothetical protein